MPGRKVTFLPEEKINTFAGYFLDEFQNVAHFLSARRKKESNHSSLFPTGRIQGVTTGPSHNSSWSPHSISLLNVVE